MIGSGDCSRGAGSGYGVESGPTNASIALVLSVMISVSQLTTFAVDCKADHNIPPTA